MQAVYAFPQGVVVPWPARHVEHWLVSIAVVPPQKSWLVHAGATQFSWQQGPSALKSACDPGQKLGLGVVIALTQLSQCVLVVVVVVEVVEVLVVDVLVVDVLVVDVLVVVVVVPPVPPVPPSGHGPHASPITHCPGQGTP
jgi:hypothetical protein